MVTSKLGHKIKRTAPYGNSREQVAVEYVLLLVIGVVIWMLLVNGLVRRDPNDPGAITGKWQQIINWIGQDQIEK